MAILKNSTIQSVDVAQTVSVNGVINQSNSNLMSGEYRSDSSYTATGPISQNQRYIDTGFNTQNNASRFTVIEEGLYYICWHNISNSGANTTRTRIYINGSNRSQARGDASGQYSMVTAIHLDYLQPGDYIELVHTNGTIYMTSQYNDFSIQRIL